jgi:hypothetical protein
MLLVALANFAKLCTGLLSVVTPCSYSPIYLYPKPPVRHPAAAEEQRAARRWTPAAGLPREFFPPRSPRANQETWGCMHRRFIIKRTLLSAFTYAAPLVSLFLGFRPLQLNQIWRILCVMYGEEGEGTLFVCLQKLYLTLCLNVFFALFNFCKIEIKRNISIWSLFQMYSKQFQKNQAVAWF